MAFKLQTKPSLSHGSCSWQSVLLDAEKNKKRMRGEPEREHFVIVWPASFLKQRPDRHRFEPVDNRSRIRDRLA